jgi:predicted aspartyl protease
MSDMGTFHTTVLIENSLRRGEMLAMPETLVDTGAELTWAPRALMESLGIKPEKRETFRMADGRVIQRDVGYAIVHAAGARTVDEVVFAEAGDLAILGSRSLEGMNLRIDPRNKQLVAAGPIVTAPAA